MKTEIHYDDKNEDENLSSEIPKEQRILRTQAYDKSISDIVSMIKEGDVVLNPDFQRSYLWDNKKASLLVESILLNVPIPVIYVAEEDDSKWAVVDGLQRLNSLRRFFDNEFKLTGLEVLTELKGLQFSTLNPKAARLLKNGILRIILIFKESNPEIKYDIFMRLNRGSIKLSEQELRNCLYLGKLSTRINNKLRSYPKFLKLIGFTATHDRFVDSELIVRYFTISEIFNRQTGKIDDYKGRIISAMNRFYEKHKAVTDDELNALEEKFFSTINKVHSVLGDSAFQRMAADGTSDGRLNRSLMDCVMLSFEDYSLDELLQKQTAIMQMQRSLPSSDKNFGEAITLGTSDKKKIELRLSTWSNNLAQIMGKRLPYPPQNVAD